jgi:hypothetical protein
LTSFIDSEVDCSTNRYLFQPTRWHAARLPNPVIAKRRPLWQFSLWDLCCVMTLTGLATGLNIWSYQHGHTWEFAFLVW